MPILSGRGHSTWLLRHGVVFSFFTFFLMSCGSGSKEVLSDNTNPNSLKLVSKVSIDHIGSTGDHYTEEYDFYYSKKGLIDSLTTFIDGGQTTIRRYVFRNDPSFLHPVSYTVSTEGDGQPQAPLHFNLVYSAGKLKNLVSEEQGSGYPLYTDTYTFDADNLFIFYDEPSDVSRNVPDSLIFTGGLLTSRSFFFTNSFYTTRTSFSYTEIANPFYDKAWQAFAPFFMSKNFYFGSLGLGSVTGYLFDAMSTKMVDHISYSQQYLGGKIGGTVTHAYTLDSEGAPVTDETVHVLHYLEGPYIGAAPLTLKANYSYEYIKMDVKR